MKSISIIHYLLIIQLLLFISNIKNKFLKCYNKKIHFLKPFTYYNMDCYSECNKIRLNNAF